MAEQEIDESSDVTNAECEIEADVTNAALSKRDVRRQLGKPKSVRVRSIGSPNDSSSAFSGFVADVTNAACPSKVKSSRTVIATLQMRDDEAPDVTNTVRSRKLDRRDAQNAQRSQQMSICLAKLSYQNQERKARTPRWIQMPSNVRKSELNA